MTSIATAYVTYQIPLTAPRQSRSCQRLTCVAYAFLYILLTLVLDDGRGNGANSDGGHGQGP